MKKALAFIAALALSAGSALAQAKFAYVDMQQASQSYWKVNDAMTKFDQDKQRLDDLRKEIQSQIDGLAQEHEQAKQDSENPALSAERQQAAKDTMQSKEDEINARRRSFEGETQRLQARAQQVQAQIEDDIRSAVKTVASRDGYDVVFPSQVAVYASNDITDEVVTELNRTQPAGSAAAK